MIELNLILIFIVCFLLSGFFSGIEMAFVSVNRLKLRELADAGSRPAALLLALYQQPSQFLTILLIGNNIVNVTATTIFVYLFKTRLAVESEWIITAVLAPLLLIFAETVPKDYGRLRSEGLLLRWAGFLRQLSRILYLPTVGILKMVDVWLGSVKTKARKSIFVSEEEFRSLIEESTKTGIVNPHEKRLIDTILDFERIQVASVMIPAGRVPTVNITATVGEVKDIARRTHTRMVLVYEEIPSIIVGMIYAFDLLFEENDKQGLKNFLRSPIFMPQATSIEKAFLTLQEKRQSFALVTDAKQEVIGAVPIERLLAV